MTDYEKLALKLALFQATMLSLIVKAVDDNSNSSTLDDSDYARLSEIHESLSFEVQTAVEVV